MVAPHEITPVDWGDDNLYKGKGEEGKEGVLRCEGEEGKGIDKMKKKTEGDRKKKPIISS